MMQEITMWHDADGGVKLRYEPDMSVPLPPYEDSFVRIVESFNLFNQRLHRLFLAIRVMLSGNESDHWQQMCRYSWALREGISLPADCELYSLLAEDVEKVDALLAWLEVPAPPSLPHETST